MRHGRANYKLGRLTAHRWAMFRNLLVALFRHERIMTTEAKAKAVRGLADQMVTLAKRDADRALEASGLAWTIVRPGALTDLPGTGLVDLAPADFGDVPRDDVAAVLFQCLLADNTIHAKFDLIGGSEPVEAAVRSLTPR